MQFIPRMAALSFGMNEATAGNLSIPMKSAALLILQLPQRLLLENQIARRVKPILRLMLMRLENQIARRVTLILQPRLRLPLENQIARPLMTIALRANVFDSF